MPTFLDEFCTRKYLKKIVFKNLLSSYGGIIYLQIVHHEIFSLLRNITNSRLQNEV